MTHSIAFDRRFVLLAGAAMLITSPAAADTARVAIHKSSPYALRGFDTTAYWSDRQAKKGASTHVVNWRGAEWRFASADDAAAFRADPERFEPQFGGYCARAMSFKKTVPADPEVWRIYGDKLYVFARPIGGTKFDETPEKIIEKATAHWNTLNLVE